jgi:GNAT superfamily N-acetyltransferase
VRFELDPPLTAGRREEIVTLWLDVSNAGGAVGFVAPVTRAEVGALAHRAFDDIESGGDRLLLGYEDDRLVSMLIFVSRRFHLTEHWRTLKRVMVAPGAQGKGYGAALVREAERVATEIGWEGLFLTVRDGHGLERFYQSLGYKEIGRVPGALRVGPGDDRDEIQMWLSLNP